MKTVNGISVRTKAVAVRDILPLTDLEVSPKESAGSERIGLMAELVDRHPEALETR